MTILDFTTASDAYLVKNLLLLWLSEEYLEIFFVYLYNKYELDYPQKQRIKQVCKRVDLDSGGGKL